MKKCMELEKEKKNAWKNNTIFDKLINGMSK